MNFTNQAISLFISGIFCLTWMGIIAIPMDNYLLIKYFNSHILTISNFSSYGVLFFTAFIFPLAYGIGNAVNFFANRSLNTRDQIIRFDIFKMNSSNSIPQIQSNINVNKYSDNKLYHQYRYRLYLESPELYNYFVFHREILRILRATSLNFIFIYLSLLTVQNNLLLNIYSYFFIILIFIKIIWFNYTKYGLFCYLFSKSKGIGALLFFSIGPFLTYFISPQYNSLYIYILILTGFISSISYFAWEYQQQNFYRALIYAIETIDGKDILKRPQ